MSIQIRNIAGTDFVVRNHQVGTRSTNYNTSAIHVRSAAGTDYLAWKREWDITSGNTSYAGAASNPLHDAAWGYGSGFGNGTWDVWGAGRNQYNLANYVSFAGYTRLHFNVTFSQTNNANLLGYLTHAGTWLHGTNQYTNVASGFTGVKSFDISGKAGGYICMQSLWGGATAILRVSRVWLT